MRPLLQGGVLAKYEALGNDYLVMSAPTDAEVPSAQMIARLCDRHRGLGSDGLLVHLPPNQAGVVARLRIFNPDGSEAQKSGNGLRIFVRYLADRGLVTEPRCTVALGQAQIAAELHDFVPARAQKAASMSSVSLHMGRFVLGAAAVGFAGRCDAQGRCLLQLDAAQLDATLVSMGNPHTVVFAQDVTAETLRRLGPRIEHHPDFAERTNVQLVRVIDDHTLEMMIWERGAGETMASGSSSCAAAVAAFVRRLCGSQVRVRMPGGELDVVIAPNDEVVLRGTCAPVFLTASWGVTAALG